MNTERYSVLFLGFTTQQYTAETIADIWEISADKVYREIGIDITGEISMMYFIGQITQNGEKVTFQIESIRNPNLVKDQSEYQSAYNTVVQNVRRILGNPLMRMTVEDIDSFYFGRI
ncbi:hypothetical protein [Faecalicatena contorta]|uniref:Uncharacterized protein n=1 Tax=Faecalicatena contorta TaxID=39482 RepID=A0A316A3N7_9FIRM|nr:hypothetical protein [Faecalicatena contorta]PWJ52123.1 hypothetical protein A8805_101294 [Faecalicatena contorta]SUQ12401.1 hypothetical protein SAMN05216529_101294 [Faecalicatena contorta]